MIAEANLSVDDHNEVGPADEGVADMQPDRVSHGREAVLGRITAALTRPFSPNEFFGQVVEAIAQELGSDYAALFLHDPATDAVFMHTSCIRGRPDAWEPAPGETPRMPRVPTATFPVWAILCSGRRALILSDPAALPASPLRQWLFNHAMKQVLYAPIILADAVIGFLSVPTTHGEHFQPEHADLAQALAHQAALAVKLGRLAEQAQKAAILAERERAERERAERELVWAAEQQAAVLDERSRLAREVHDTIAQALVGAIHLLEAAKDAAARRPEKAARCVEEALRVAREGLDDARRAMQALRPPPLDGVDLAQALRGVAGRPGDGGAAVDVRIVGPPQALGAEVERELFRIAQEAVANSHRHAQATCIKVELRFESDFVRLTVRDDGCGFDLAAGSGGGGGFGLIGMRERAARVGGRASVTSRPGGGTEVTAVVPINRGRIL